MASIATPAHASAVAIAHERCGRASFDRPLDPARQRGRGAERDDRADGDAGVGDGGEERELVGRDRAGGDQDRPAREPRERLKTAGEDRDDDEQAAADEDPRRADTGGGEAARAERLGGAGGAEHSEARRT